jgi:hypothetical protein
MEKNGEQVVMSDNDEEEEEKEKEEEEQNIIRTWNKDTSSCDSENKNDNLEKLEEEVENRK